MKATNQAILVAQWHADSEMRESRSNKSERAHDKQISAQTEAVEKQLESGKSGAKDTRDSSVGGAIAGGLGIAAACCIAFPPAAIVLGIAALAVGLVTGLMHMAKQNKKADLDHEAGQANIEVTKAQKDVEEATSKESEVKERMRQRMQVALQQQQELSKAVEM